MADDPHRTYVELSHDGTYYFWCEADDCYATHHHYHTEAEAYAAAEMHERNPG